MVPLFWSGRDDEARDFVHQTDPSSRVMAIDRKAKYLGIYLGPEAGYTGWAEPLHKFTQRVMEWSRMHLGTQYDALVYACTASQSLAFPPVL